jgi:alpha-tubulin suppressor-like RCC1 family protein
MIRGTSREIVCWGDPVAGGLGDGSTESRHQPVEVGWETTEPLEGIAGLAVGDDFACARGENAGLWCWGAGSDGRIGDGASEARTRPSPVVGYDARRAVDLAAGAGHACAVDAEGEVRCWGDNRSGQLGPGAPRASMEPVVVALPAPADAVAAGRAHSCALTGENVWCWGSNEQRQLGDPEASGAGPHAPRYVAVGAIDVAAGGDRTCAITREGELLCWGAVPGNGTAESSEPVFVVSVP